jgi:hypothetical protein
MTYSSQLAWAIAHAKATALCIADRGLKPPSSPRPPPKLPNGGGGFSPAGRGPDGVPSRTTAPRTTAPHWRGERQCLSYPAPPASGGRP